MKKKILCCFLSILLVVINVLPLSTPFVFAQTRTNLNASGIIDSITIEPHDVQDGSNVKVEVSFSEKSSQQIKPGDTLTLRLPNDSSGALEAYNHSYDLRTSDGKTIGRVVISNGQVQVTFTEEVAKLEHVHGNFEFTCTANNKTGKDGTEGQPVTITSDFGISGITPPSVTIQPSETVGPGGGKYPFYYKTGTIEKDANHEVTYWLNANLNKDYLSSDIVIEDQIGSGQEMLWDKCEIYLDSTMNSDSAHNCTLTPQEFVEKGYGKIELIDGDKNHFKITINQDKIRYTTVTVRYRTKITDLSQKEFDNQSKATYKKFYDNQPTTDNSNISIDNVYLGGSGGGDTPTSKTELNVKKQWIDANDQDGIRPEFIEVQLYANGKPKGEKVVLNDSNHWFYTWKDLPTKENGQKIEYTVKEVSNVPGYTTKVERVNRSFLITNTHEPETTEVRGLKVWQDNHNQDNVRPSSIIVRLYADGVEVDQKVVTGVGDEWKYEFTNLPKYKDGKKIQYIVREDKIPNYVSTNKESIIVNTHKLNKTSIDVLKAWDDKDDQDGKRPTSIQVQLYANDTIKVGHPVTLNENNHWSYSWDGLDENKDGKKIRYSVKEISKIPGYETSITDKGNGTFVITNRHEVEYTSIKGKKIWRDGQDQDKQRPAKLMIHLYANGKEVSTQVITGTGDTWNYEFTHLPKYENGKEIQYTVTEDRIPNYTGQIEGTTITNTHSPNETHISVLKRWEDEGNQDGKRPSSIQVQLYANGKEKGTPITLDEKNKWSYTWDHLPQNEAGKEIHYEIKEISNVPGYTSSQTIRPDGTIVLTNTYAPEQTEIKGKKIWQDHNNEDQKRPKAILVFLYADGVQVDKQLVHGEGNEWQFSFKNLPKYKEGKEIHYSIKEEKVPEYTTKIEGTTVTNTYQPETTQISVKKEWKDDNNAENKRPSSIQVQLYANGKPQGEAIELNEKNHWSYQWTGLKEKEAGKKIIYTVKEKSIPKDYESTVTKESLTSFIIVNTFVPPVTPPEKPETTEIRGEKVWEDHHNQDRVRPESIEIHLYANGKEVAKKEVTGTGDRWSYEFTNLPKFEEGKEIQYTVTEDKIPNYTGKIEGTTITNTHAPNETHLTVMKRWEDNNNEDKKRPEAIKVQLYVDGKEKGEPVFLNEENQWSYTWSHLPEKVDGKKIKYEVKEVTKVLGYETSQKVGEDGTVVITNTYTKPPKPPVPPVTPPVESSDTESTKEDTTESSVPVESTETTTPIESTETTKPVESTESTETTSSTHSTESSTTEESESSTSPSSESTREGEIFPPKTSSSAKPTKEERKEKGKLPQTGTRSSLEFILVGWALVSSAVILFFLYKKYRS